MSILKEKRFAWEITLFAIQGMTKANFGGLQLQKLGFALLFTVLINEFDIGFRD